MNRLLVALLAAFDALIAAAVGVAAVLAPLTVFWVVGLGGADWGTLWPTSVRIWQLGNLVPLQITLPPEYLTATGIPTDAGQFWLSLAPLAFAGGVAIFAARSGARAARAGAWILGVASGTLVTAVIAWLLWRSSANPVAAVYGWQALLLPTAVFALPALGGAVVGAWRHGDDGPVDALRLRLTRDTDWASVPEAAARGLGVAVAGFVGVGALLVAIATLARGGQVVALFESAHVDALGATMVELGQLAYLPTLVVWGGAFAAGPGFALGTGTTVSPVGTDIGVLPGIPLLGIVPETVSSWMLLSVLLIVAVGFIAGATARVRQGADAGTPAPRLAVLGIIVIGGGAGAALLAALASGSIGPGRLAEVGPAPGAVALAVGVELAVGAAIALFSPVHRSHPYAAAHPDAYADPRDGTFLPTRDVSRVVSGETFRLTDLDAGESAADAEETQPLDVGAAAREPGEAHEPAPDAAAKPDADRPDEGAAPAPSDDDPPR